jgi:hypothetical protein
MIAPFKHHQTENLEPKFNVPRVRALLMTVEELDMGTKTDRTDLHGVVVCGGRSMTVADTYRRYAAECVSMSTRLDNPSDKAQCLKMATMWLRLAEFAEKNERPDDSFEDL